MSASTRMKLLGVVAGVAAAVAVAAPAQALSDYGTIVASADFQVRNAESGGVFRFTDLGGTFAPSLFTRPGDPAGTFIGICIEIGEFFTGTGTYTVRDVTDAPLDSPGPMGDQRAEDVAKLVTLALGGDIRNALTTANLVAFQVALWELTTDRTGPYNLGDGTFQRTIGSNTQYAQARDWLDALILDKDIDSIARASGLLALTLAGKQDMLIQTPIPAAAWLLASGLLGLFGISRRRKVVAA